MKTLAQILIILILIPLAFFAYTYGKARHAKVPLAPTTQVETQSTSTRPISWQNYTNVKYGFSLSYPSNWEVHEEDDNRKEPVINFYPKGEQVEFPITHQSDEMNVSVFPKGLPTEGVLGTTRPTRVAMNETTDQALDFVLESGETWATFVAFKNPPKSWEKWGFVWAHVPVHDLKTYCMLNGQEVAADKCDIGGDTPIDIRRTGTVNEEDRKIEERILGSLEFAK